MIVTTLLGTKGGVGKTTNAANIGGILADMGHRVLLIDADYQGSLSRVYELKHKQEDGVYAMLTMRTLDSRCISQTRFDNLDIVLSDIASNDVTTFLRNRLDRDRLMRQAIRSNFVLQNYDYVIIDSQGARGELQDACALAADEIICPVAPDALSTREFADATLNILQNLTQASIPHGRFRALVTKFEQLKDAKHYVGELREVCRSLGKLDKPFHVSVMNTVVPYAKAYKEAMTKQIPVHLHEPSKANIGTSPRAVQPAGLVMHQVVWELFPNLIDVYANSYQGADISLPNEERTQPSIKDDNLTPSTSVDAGAGVNVIGMKR